MEKIKNKIKELYEKHFKSDVDQVKNFYKKHLYFKVFSIVFILTCIVFFPHIIADGFAIPMNGDYSLQQLHFYCEGHDAFWHFIKTGEVTMWSGKSFLGVNYFAANTFYYLSSPFLLPFLFTPKILIPQMLFLMMVVKIATGGTLFFILMHHFYKTTEKTALLGAIAYGLCGWGMYYLWFNHFHDVLALFPLLLIGIEHVLQNKKGWCLSLALMLVGMANYFFLFGFAILGVLYALFRYFRLFKTNKGHNAKILGQGILYYLLGIVMVAYVLLPAFNIVMDQSRVENSSLILELFKLFFENPIKGENGYELGNLKSFETLTSKENLDAIWNYFFVFSTNENDQLIRFFTPISQTLFPSVNNFDATLFKNKSFDNFQSSMFISFPLIMLAIVKMIETFKKHNVWSIIGMLVVIIMPLIPFTYYLVNAFTLMYGRWELFIVAIFLINALPILDKINDTPKWEIDVAFVLTIILMISCVAVALHVEKFVFNDYRGYVVIGYAAYCVIAYLLIRYEKKGKGAYENITLLTIVELMVCGFITSTGQGTVDYWAMYGGQDRFNEQRTIINDLNARDDVYYRIENSLEDRNNNNMSMTLGYNSLSQFHSVYTKNLDKFINTYSKASYSNGNWSMGIDEKRANLNEFLGVRYEILEKGDTNIPFGYELYKSYNYFDVYENTHFIELGFSFTDIINEKNFNNFSATHFNYEAYMLKGAVINENDFEEVSSLMQNEKILDSAGREFTSAGNLVYSYKPREEQEFSEEYTSFSKLKDLLPEGRNENLYGPWVANNMTGDKVRIRNKNNSPLVPTGYNHVIVKLTYGPNVMVRLFDEDGNLIVQDDHGVNYYDHGGDHKYARGFYVNKAVYSVELEMIADAPVSQFTRSGFGVYYQSYIDYYQTVQTLEEYAVSDVKHTQNTFDFKTNYNEQRFVVLHIPNDSGWKLTNELGEVKIYECNGGFIGFIAESGNHTYHLSYVTPSLMTGIKVSLGGTLIYLILLLGTYYDISFKDKKLKIVKKSKSNDNLDNLSN